MPARLRACDRSRMRNRCDIDMIPAALAPPGRGSPYGSVGDRGVSSWFAWTGRGRRRLRGAWLVLPGLLLSACGEADQTPAAAPPPPAVSVVEVEPQDVTPSSQFVGRVVAIDQVDLRARVQGFLEQRLFTEGQDVKKGDLLYVIEQPPFQAQVEEAAGRRRRAPRPRSPRPRRRWSASRRRAPVVLSASRRSTRRSQTTSGRRPRCSPPRRSCRSPSSISATPRSRAPIDGRIGLTTYTVGNLVGPDSNVARHDRQRGSDLRHLPGQQPGHPGGPQAGRRSRASRTQFVVRAQLPDGTTYAHPGTVNFLDIEADQTTDTITVRAEFPIPRACWSTVSSSMSTVERDQPEERLVVPQPALQLDQAGSYVLLVNSQDEVEQRRIQTGQPTQGNLVVQSGLQPGERVIVEGDPEGPAGHEGAGDRRPAATERTPTSAPSAASEPRRVGRCPPLRMRVRPAARRRPPMARVRLPRPVAPAHRRRPTALPPRPRRQRASRSGR